MPKLKQYRIGVWEEQGGYLTVKAKNKEEAIRKAEEHMDEFGFNEDIDGTHRSTDVFIGDITLIK